MRLNPKMDRKFSKEHEQTLVLLPWYVNDTLESKDSTLVLQHLAACEACRVERDRLYQLQGLVSENTDPPPDFRGSFMQVMGRIENAEVDRRSLLEVEPFFEKKNFLHFGLAASILIAALGSGVWMTSYTPSPIDEFKTLTIVSQEKGVIHHLELNFADTIQAPDLRQALIDSGSRLVAGPDKEGIYLVEVEIPAKMSDSEFLKWIVNIKGIERAQYVDQHVDKNAE